MARFFNVTDNSNRALFKAAYAGNDSIDGTGGADRIRGWGGRDTIWGEGGNDEIRGDGVGLPYDPDLSDTDPVKFADSIRAGAGNDSVWGGGGNDTILGEDGSDRLYGQGGGDSIDGGRGADEIVGAEGNDVCKGGADNDWIVGGPGRDSLYGDAGDDKIYAFAGADFAARWGWIDTGEGDQVDGGAGNDKVLGSAGSDTICGGDGNDTLTGGPGSDKLNGGYGFDVAVYDSFPSSVGRGNGLLGLVPPNERPWLISVDGTTDELKQIEQVRVDRDGSTHFFNLDCRNNAPIAFNDAAETRQNTPLTVTAASLLANDYDFEGDKLAITGVGNGQHGTVARNDGTFTFTPDADYFGPASFDYTITDGRGGSDTGTVTVSVINVLKPDLDILTFISGALGAYDSQLLFNNGIGTFTAATGPSFPATPQDVALGDIDGDGDLDAFVAGTFSSALAINDGSGSFTARGDAYTQFFFPGGVALGDLDGDDDLDAIVANEGLTLGYPNTLFINDGSGNFTASALPDKVGQSVGVALGDVDGDDDLDAIIVNARLNPAAALVPTQLLINDGTGHFTASDLPPSDLKNDCDVALGDLDGDGDLDAFVLSAGTNRLLINDGAGHFTVVDAPGPSGYKGKVALGDLDGDGDLDAFVQSTNTNRILINDGAGHFTAVDAPGPTGSTYRNVDLGDLDGDGDLDAFVGNQLLINNGRASFTAFDTPGSGAPSALGDLDGDGELAAVGDDRLPVLAADPDLLPIIG